MNTKIKAAAIFSFILSIAANIANIVVGFRCINGKMIYYEGFLWFTPLFILAFWGSILYSNLLKNKNKIEKTGAYILDILAIALIAFWMYECFIAETVFISLESG